jgi:Zn-dependent protease
MTPIGAASVAGDHSHVIPHSFRIGRVAGIEIRVHITFFLLVPLFALAGAEPGGPGVLGGIAWLVVIFACVLVHEFAHCLVGRPRGAVVHEIELLPIGGVSKLEHLPENPRDEFAMAIAGPAASAAIAAVAAILALALSEPLLPVDLFGGSILPRLVWFNLLIAAFNLLPAFPLDGGRVLRALLERRLDLEHATRVAARVGRWVALAFIVVGLFWDVWLVIIGVFVYFGAAAEEAATIVHVRLQGQRVGDLMLLEPRVVEPGADLEQLRDLVRRSSQRVFPVVGPRGYEGLLEADAVGLGAQGGTAAELVERDAPLLSPTDGLEASLLSVTSAPARALAVMDGSEVVGLLRREEIEHLMSRLTQEQKRRAAGGR